ncbi:uncharacterized protein PAC_00696 [Phialocephala subalpina]|uniref:Uncharacterized protein n=1 Tax=Phialocephala subalpina TaxID=576137 RepID=A0A1L7WDF6_9HELO|nr:uncharacterized protein PAC_00696 [Phialocephala subalpina]
MTALAPPPPYSAPPPRYSQVVDPNPQRYAVSNGQVWPVPQQPVYPAPQTQPMPAPQSRYFPQPVPVAVPQTYLLSPQYQQPYTQSPYPCNYPYPQPTSSPHANQFPGPFYQQRQPLPQPLSLPQPQQIIYQPTPQAPLQIGPAVPDDFEAPPPPPGYVTIPGTNYAVPEEWMSEEFKGEKKYCLKEVFLPVLYWLRALLGKKLNVETTKNTCTSPNIQSHSARNRLSTTSKRRNIIAAMVSEPSPPCCHPLLLRFKSLSYTPTNTPFLDLPAAKIILDPLCSRSFLSLSTLENHFPSLLNKTYAYQKPTHSIFEEGTPIKAYDCVTVSLAPEDTTSEEVKIEIAVRVSLVKERGLDGMVVFGKDFWEREDVEVWWAGGGKIKDKENKRSWWGWGEGKNEEFLGLVLGVKMVRFEMN